MDTCGAERVQNGEKFIHAVKREVKEEKRREKPGWFVSGLSTQFEV